MNIVDGSDQSMSLETNPWKGLFFYTEEDRDIFFGRKRETEDLVRIVQRAILSVLFARSGLGKTSLLRAGVMPKLREGNYLPVIVRIDYSSSAEYPTQQILSAIIEAAKKSGIEIEPVDPSIQTISPENSQYTLWEIFHEFQFWSPRNDLISPVLILDQFEEVFTLGQQNPHAEVFLNQLADLSENRMPSVVISRIEKTGERPLFDTRAENYRVILSLREDFVPKLDSLRSMIPSVMRNRFALTPLDQEQGIEIVLHAGGKWVTDPVAREIVATVAGKNREKLQQPAGNMARTEIEPAYLSVMCHELFRRMTELGRCEIGLDLVALEQGNILEGLYKRSFEGLPPDVRVFVEDRLLTATGFRGSVPLAETALEGISRSQLETLVDRRLVRFEDRLGATHVELSHDLLTRIVAKSRNQRALEAEKEVERLKEEEFKEKLRRSRFHALALALAIVVLVGGIAFSLFGWVVPHHSYYADFSRCFSKPKIFSKYGPIHPLRSLSKAEVEHRWYSLRVTSEGWFGKIRSVEAIDSKYRLTSTHNIRAYLSTPSVVDLLGIASLEEGKNECRLEFVYDQNSHAVYEVAYDRLNQMVWGLVYAPVTTAGDSIIQKAKATFLGADGYPAPRRHSRAEYIEIVYDENGFETEHHYRDRDGHPMPGPQGEYGRRMEYDNSGRVIRQTSLDAHGEPMINEDAIAVFEVQYNQKGDIIRTRYLDEKGTPTSNKNGVHRTEIRNDAWGTQYDCQYFDLFGRPTVEAEIQAHRIVVDLTQHGLPESIKCFGVSDEPVMATMLGMSFHELRISFNSRNLIKTASWFDTAGNPSSFHGIYGMSFNYDKNGFKSSERILDEKGQLGSIESAGITRITSVNDSYGRVLEQRYFGMDDKPILSKETGYHLQKNSYDKNGNLLRQSYFGIDGEPVEDQTDGSHLFVRTYDRFGNPLTSQYFDSESKPINNKQGFHKKLSLFDEYGSETETRWFDKNGGPCAGPDGIHKVVKSYERGLVTNILRYDTNGTPITDHEGIFETRFSYNRKRQQTLYTLFGSDHQPVEDENGNHVVLHEYNDYGKEIKITRLRADGSPNWDRELGIATVTHVYDNKGNLIEYAFYNASNELVIGTFGYSKGVTIHESDGTITSINYGPNGNVVLNPLHGWAILKKDQHEKGTTVDSYYNPESNLINGPEGYAQLRRQWDNGGGLLSESYWNSKGTPTFGPSGYHRSEIKRSGVSEEVRYFDTDNMEIPSLKRGNIIPIIFIAQIADIKQPAIKAGLQAGDIIWAYGNWSFPQALEAYGQLKSDTEKKIYNTTESLIKEIELLSSENAQITVIRDGQKVILTMPVLPQKKAGVYLQNRSVPIKIYEEWKKMDQ